MANLSIPLGGGAEERLHGWILTRPVPANPMSDDVGPGIAAPGDQRFRGLPQVPEDPTRGRGPSIVLRSRGVAYAP